MRKSCILMTMVLIQILAFLIYLVKLEPLQKPEETSNKAFVLKWSLLSKNKTFTISNLLFLWFQRGTHLLLPFDESSIAFQVILIPFTFSEYICWYGHKATFMQKFSCLSSILHLLQFKSTDFTLCLCMWIKSMSLYQFVFEMVKKLLFVLSVYLPACFVLIWVVWGWGTFTISEDFDLGNSR